MKRHDKNNLIEFHLKRFQMLKRVGEILQFEKKVTFVQFRGVDI